ncbi:MAG: hypothetical protein UH077_07850 [Bacteroidales bacterium]|jgi:hypothetical protein|nr:hypothetical protein [Bacteroidales bacterium]
MSKALLIKSQINKDGGEVGKWNNFNDSTSYIQGIHTGKILEDISAEKLGALISGVPTPWARAKLFKFAFDTITSTDPNIRDNSLMQFYNMLHSEWKGLMAVIALYPDRIRFSNPVIMDIRGDDYDIASAFGRMLFSDKDIWSNQDELAKNQDAQPFIQLIYYRDHLVGGTSPLTGCFTGVDYSKLGEDASDINWYRQGKFEDPTNVLTPEEIQKVYLFVNNMNKNQQAFEQKINSQRGNNLKIDLQGFKQISRQWEDELKTKGQNRLKDIGPIAQYENLSIPFADLYKSDVPVYMKSDYTFTYTDTGECERLGNIQDLLSKDKYVVGWGENADELTKLSHAPVYYLKVPDLNDNSNSYFSLPLSEKGIDIFKNNLSSLLDSSTGGNTKLSAKINDAGQLAVTLIVEIDGEPITLSKKEYKIHWMDFNKRVILWPNFVSDDWNKYYLYSEFTSDANETFIPFFKNTNNILKNIRGEFLTSDYEYTPEEEKQVEVKELVTYPHGQGAELKYNIIGANKPMAGVLVKVKEAGKPCGAGFIIFKKEIVRDLTGLNTQSSATIGIDFGSNNTCVYYNANHHGAQPIQFKNYRTIIVGKENIDTRAIAENNELLFFSNYESNNGQLKSWLHEHDNRYTPHSVNQEIAGGVPVNRPNIDVKRMDEFIIETQAGKLHYNMKWLNDDNGLLKKRAFIKSVWLQACAFLYQNHIRPSQINWSYPGSMMEADVDELEKIFEDLCHTMPIAGRRPTLNNTLTTEAEAVCSFALSNADFGLNNDNMFLGIDVGGSTSDILLLAKNPAQGNQVSLFKESSVRLAAGVFFNTVINSEDFRRALLNFHEGRSTNVHVANIQEIVNEKDKAPYYLNSIFDQLKSAEDYDKFYTSIADNARTVFTLPAYVTGLLLYYSGMLIGKTIKDNNLDNIRRIDVLSFGKGGRLFHWLRNAASSRATSEYYATCLNAGVRRIINKELEVKYRDEIEVDNKAEVAKGLCDLQNINKVFDGNQTDICGEEGIRFTDTQGASRELLPTDELSSEYFDNDMNYFDFSNIKCFEEFFNIFINFVSTKTKLCTADSALREELADLPNKVSSFIRQDSEYKSAKRKVNNGIPFAYHQPLLIAEGACFIEKSLIKKVFSR